MIQKKEKRDSRKDLGWMGGCYSKFKMSGSLRKAMSAGTELLRGWVTSKVGAVLVEETAVAMVGAEIWKLGSSLSKVALLTLDS